MRRFFVVSSLFLAITSHAQQKEIGARVERILAQLPPGRWRLIPWTAFSRMYLGRHWPSDTIAGMALGVAWDAVIITFPRAL